VSQIYVVFVSIPADSGVLEAKEALPIMETTEIARELRPVPGVHERCPVSAEYGIQKAGFLSPPPRAFVPRDCVELLLKPAPIDSPVDRVDARVDLGSYGVHGSRAHGHPFFPLLSGPKFGRHPFVARCSKSSATHFSPCFYNQELSFHSGVDVTPEGVLRGLAHPRQWVYTGRLGEVECGRLSWSHVIRPNSILLDLYCVTFFPNDHVLEQRGAKPMGFRIMVSEHNRRQGVRK
jgi:hypothetical protein